MIKLTCVSKRLIAEGHNLSIDCEICGICCNYLSPVCGCGALNCVDLDAEIFY